VAILTPPKVPAYTVTPMTARDQRNEALGGVATGWAITGTMVGGLAAWGGLGYLLDRLLGTQHVFATAGFLLGAVGAIYIVWLRYGRGEGDGS
jgi:F0F1-type ATP synthase assembly protein I